MFASVIKTKFITVRVSQISGLLEVNYMVVNFSAHEICQDTRSQADPDMHVNKKKLYYSSVLLRKWITKKKK